jgi:hypothetical protein
MRQRVVIALALAAEPQAHRGRRAHHGAGRVDPGADHFAAQAPVQGPRRGGDAGHARHGRDRRDLRPRGRAVRRPRGRDRARWAMSSTAPPPLHGRPDGLDPGDGRRPRTPAADRRRDAAPERHPARLRLQPALPAGHGPLPARAARTAGAGATRAACWLVDQAPQSRLRRTAHDDAAAGAGARPGQDLRRLGALAQPRRGTQAAPVRARGGRRQLQHRARQDAGPGGRIGLRQEHGGAAAGGPVPAHARRGALRRPGHRCGTRCRPSCARCAGACR